MIYYISSGLINAITSIILGIFVYTRNRKNKKNITFLIFCLTIAEWNYAYFMWMICANANSALFWVRTLMVGAIFVSSAFFHYVLEFLELNSGRKRTFLLCSYVIDLALVLFAYSPFLVASVSKKMFFNYWPNAGPLFYFFSMKVLIFAVYSNALLYKAYRNSHGILAYQQKLTFWAGVMGYVGGIPTLPLWFNIPIPPFTHITVSVFMVIFAYAIVQYRLLDIEVFIKKTFVFGGLLAFVFAILILPTLLIQEYILRTASLVSRTVGLVISGIIIILTMRRIETFLINLTDKYLFQKKYNYKELLKTFTSEVLTVLEIDKLLDLTRRKLKEIIKLDFCDLEIFDDSNKPDNSIRVMAKSKGYILRSDYPSIKEELIIPLTINNETIGMLSLGKKKSDEEYTQDDMDILLPLARTLTIAISNAQLVKELRNTQDEAAQKEKMATLGTLAAGMAHEIRNPITTIRIFSEYLPDKIREVQFVDKYRDIVVKQVDKINHVVQAMIDFSAEDASAEVESVSLNEKISELIELLGLSDSIPNDIEFTKSIPPSLPRVEFNARELDEILLNLAQNASQAIKDKGEISFNAFEKGESVILQIKDNGCGMPEEVQKHLFSPFFTTKSKGFGLGLFVVKELINRNHGKIFVESSIGTGTTFTLEFKKA